MSDLSRAARKLPDLIAAKPSRAHRPAAKFRPGHLGSSIREREIDVPSGSRGGASPTATMNTIAADVRVTAPPGGPRRRRVVAARTPADTRPTATKQVSGSTWY